MNIPKDPVMLLSFLNLKLRDEFSDLDDLCKSLDIDKTEVVGKIKTIGYDYSKAENRFVWNWNNLDIIMRGEFYD